MDLHLLAQTTAPAPSFETVLLAYGPLGVFALVVLYFVIRWGDKTASGHVTLVKVCSDTQLRMADSVEAIQKAVESFTDTAVSGRNHSQKAHEVIVHIAKGHLAESSSPEAKRHFERAIEASQDS